MERQRHTCILSKKDFEPSTPEHILLAAVGGRKTTTTLVSPDVNHQFGESHDRDLAEQLANLRNLLDLRSGRRKDAPAIRGVGDIDGVKLNIAPGGKPELGAARVEVAELAAGQFRLRITARDEDEAARLLAGQLVRFKVPADGIDKVVDDGILEESTAYLKGYVPLDFHLGGSSHLRSVAKMIFTYFAQVVGAEVTLDPAFDEIRSFIMSDADAAAATVCNHEHRPAPSFASAKLAKAPLLTEIIVIASKRRGCVYGYLKIFGNFVFSCLLARSWSAKPLYAAYSIDPESGAHDETFERREYPNAMTVDGVLRHEVQMPTMKARTERLLSYAHDKSVKRAISENVNRIVRECMPPEGERIEQRHIAALSREIPEWYLRFAHRISERRPADREDLRARVKTHFSKMQGKPKQAKEDPNDAR